MSAFASQRRRCLWQHENIHQEPEDFDLFGTRESETATLYSDHHSESEGGREGGREGGGWVGGG